MDNFFRVCIHFFTTPQKITIFVCEMINIVLGLSHKPERFWQKRGTKMFAYSVGQVVVVADCEAVVFGIVTPEDAEMNEPLYSVKFVGSGLSFSVPESTIEGVR